MRSRTVFQCWFFISCFLFIGLMSEFCLYTFAHQKDLSMHRIAPITSLPLLIYPKLRQTHEEGSADLIKINYIQVVLKGGKKLDGKLISEENGWLILDMDGSQIGLKKSEIEKIIPTNPKA